MRVEAIELTIKVRGSSKVEHGIIEYARSLGKKRHKCAKHKQIKQNDASYYKSYTKVIS